MAQPGGAVARRGEPGGAAGEEGRLGGGVVCVGGGEVAGDFQQGRC